MRSIRIFAKNMGDPYYEPTIVVHDKTPKAYNSTLGPAALRCCVYKSDTNLMGVLQL